MRIRQTMAALLCCALLPAVSLPAAAAAPGSAIPASASASAPAAASAAPLLPESFAGWQSAGPAMTVSSPEQADAPSSGVLRECGMTSAVTAKYTRSDNRLTLHALRFGDASGAYAAYTFYRQPGWPAEDIGAGAASDNHRVLFWQGNTVVDAVFDQVTPMSAAELRELAAALPMPAGGAAQPPPVLAYLPAEGLVAHSMRYALGPEGYQRSRPALPVAAIGFDRGAEVVSAEYGYRDGSGVLTLIEYPTAQLAAAEQRAIESLLHSPSGAWPRALAESRAGALEVRRSGPLVAVTSGGFAGRDARRLIGLVNFNPRLTWNKPQGYVGEAAKTARLLLGIFALTAFLGGTAIVAGLFFGGGRALYRRLRGRPVSSLEETDIIRLNLP